MTLSAFLKKNAVKEENLKIVVSKRFEEDGKPVEWEIRSLSTTEESKIKKECTRKVKVGKGVYRPETDYDEYLAKLAATCTVYPDLKNADLQDSYGVMGADKVLKEMLKPGEYAEYINKIQEFNGFDLSMDDLVEEAKN